MPNNNEDFSNIVRVDIKVNSNSKNGWSSQEPKRTFNQKNNSKEKNLYYFQSVDLKSINANDIKKRKTYQEVSDALDIKKFFHNPKETIEDLSKLLKPISKSINSESDFQAIIQGMFLSLAKNDLNNNIIRVFSEANPSNAGRIDLVISHLKDNKGEIHEQSIAIIELKFSNSDSKDVQKKLSEANGQLLKYNSNLKSFTDLGVFTPIAAVFDQTTGTIQYEVHPSQEIAHTSINVRINNDNKRKLVEVDDGEYFNEQSPTNNNMKVARYERSLDYTKIYKDRLTAGITNTSNLLEKSIFYIDPFKFDSQLTDKSEVALLTILNNYSDITVSSGSAKVEFWPIIVLKELTTTIVNAMGYWLANMANSTLQSPNMLINIDQRVYTNNTHSYNRVSNSNYSANSDDSINIKPQEDTRCVPYIWDKNSQEYVTDYVAGCTLPHGHLKVFANIHQGDNTIQTKGYHISGDTYKNCRPIEFEGGPSVYCQGKKSNMVYTANVQLPTVSLDAINAQLMLTRVFGIDKLIGELIIKSKIFLGLEQDSSNQLQEEANEIELAEITDQQINRWQDSIKDIKCLIETLSSQAHQENNEQNLNWAKEASFILEDSIEEVSNLSKQQSLVNVEEITELDKKLKCLQIDLEESFNLPNSSSNQLEEFAQNNSQQQESNSMYGGYPTYEHLVHNMSVLHVDNTSWCPNTRDFSYMTAYQYTQIAHNANL